MTTHAYRTFSVGLLVILMAGGTLTAQTPGVQSSRWQEQLLAQQLKQEDRAERLRLATEIMDEQEARSGRAYDASWKKSKVHALAEQPREELGAILDNVRAGIGIDVRKALGDSQADLVFTPLVTPCRAYDSRADNVAGPLPANTTFTFTVAGVIPFGQGGSSNCGVPFGAATAIVGNVLAVDTGGKGQMKVWPFEGFKGDSSINFAANRDLDINLINGVMLPICDPLTSGTGCAGGDLNVEVAIAPFSDFVISVSGYFSAPEATPLDCQTISDSRSVPASMTWNFTAGSCPAGYVMTGGGYNYTVNVDDVELWQVGPAGDTFRCRGSNPAGNATENIICYARCCRVPGI